MWPGRNFTSDFWGGGVYPTSKDGSALEYPSSSKILGLPNVWSSDLCVCSMLLNSQTLGRSCDTFGCCLDAVETLLGTPGALLGALGALLARSWNSRLGDEAFDAESSWQSSQRLQ